MRPVEAKVGGAIGGAMGGALGADTEPLVAFSVRVFVFDRPVGFHVSEVQIVVCGTRLAPGECVTMGTVPYGRIVLLSISPYRDFSSG
jgi:hypothetical protein